jgi:hypothetical protein
LSFLGNSFSPSAWKSKPSVSRLSQEVAGGELPWRARLLYPTHHGAGTIALSGPRWIFGRAQGARNTGRTQRPV